MQMEVSTKQNLVDSVAMTLSLGPLEERAFTAHQFALFSLVLIFSPAFFVFSYILLHAYRRRNGDEGKIGRSDPILKYGSGFFRVSLLLVFACSVVLGYLPCSTA